MTRNFQIALNRIVKRIEITSDIKKNYNNFRYYNWGKINSNSYKTFFGKPSFIKGKIIKFKTNDYNEIAFEQNDVFENLELQKIIKFCGKLNFKKIILKTDGKKLSDKNFRKECTSLGFNSFLIEFKNYKNLKKKVHELSKFNINIEISYNENLNGSLNYFYEAFFVKNCRDCLDVAITSMINQKHPENRNEFIESFKKSKNPWSKFFKKRDSYNEKRLANILLNKYLSDESFNLTLDVGCGSYDIKKYLDVKFGNLIYLDWSYHALKNIKNTKIKIVGDINNIPIKRNCVDIIFCYDVLYYIDEKIGFKESLKKIIEIMKYKGKLILFHNSFQLSKDKIKIFDQEEIIDFLISQKINLIKRFFIICSNCSTIFEILIFRK